VRPATCDAAELNQSAFQLILQSASLARHARPRIIGRTRGTRLLTKPPVRSHRGCMPADRCGGSTAGKLLVWHPCRHVVRRNKLSPATQSCLRSRRLSALARPLAASPKIMGLRSEGSWRRAPTESAPHVRERPSRHQRGSVACTTNLQAPWEQRLGWPENRIPFHAPLVKCCCAARSLGQRQNKAALCEHQCARPSLPPFSGQYCRISG